jgi:hypothetical protein
LEEIEAHRTVGQTIGGPGGHFTVQGGAL